MLHSLRTCFGHNFVYKYTRLVLILLEHDDLLNFVLYHTYVRRPSGTTLWACEMC